MENVIEIPSNLKISLTLTMKIQIQSFIKKHNGCIDIYETEEDLIDSLFFFWFFNSSKMNYKWQQQKNIFVFLNEHSHLLKKRLEIMLNEMNYKE